MVMDFPARQGEFRKVNHKISLSVNQINDLSSKSAKVDPSAICLQRGGGGDTVPPHFFVWDILYSCDGLQGVRSQAAGLDSKKMWSLKFFVPRRIVLFPRGRV
jgi:hypothetical protein